MDNPLEVVINKYFRDGKVLYFHPADAIFDDQYLRWEYHKGERKKILISVGSNDGEVRVNIFTEADKLEQFIKLAIY
jgi:hypothetical protein